MRIINEVKLDFKDVLIVPKRSTLKSRAEVDLTRTLVFRHSPHEYRGIPIIAANMDGVGTPAMARALARHKMATALTKHYLAEDLIAFFQEVKSAGWDDNVFYSMGITKPDLEKFSVVKEFLTPKIICMDVANFYTETAIEFLKRFRDSNPNPIIIAGNVATPEITEELILAGADIVKVGIGSGNVCSTRIKTGVGYPQLSAIIECADAAHGLKGLIVADGGITCPGDLAKAFGAGADFCMLGSYMAGYDEGGGEVYQNAQGDSCVSFYGMSSHAAQSKHGENVKDYRASEGRIVDVPYKGPVDAAVQDLLGGLRSACTYTGSNKLKDLSKRTTFVQVHQQIATLYGVGKL